MLRRTKILTTLGPATDNPKVLADMLRAGADVVRVNFSHGDPQAHAKRVEMVRSVAEQVGKWVAVLGDLQGPKIRIERFAEGKVVLNEGDAFALDVSLDARAGNQSAVGVAYKSLPKDVRAGDVLLLNDGQLVLDVTAVNGPRIDTRVVIGGELSDNKGINKQGGGLSAGALTDKDRIDIKLAAQLGVDYMAVSFARDGSDMDEARELLRKEGGHGFLVAKIERSEALVNLDRIIQASDAVMVARGDLGVEVGYAELTGLQKHIIAATRKRNRVVITATQMMESMIHNPMPTRAEVSDVANAVMDGTDAVMLSGESAVGKYPVKAVEAMSQVILGAEKYESSHSPVRHRAESGGVREDRRGDRDGGHVHGQPSQGAGDRRTDRVGLDAAVDVAYPLGHSHLCIHAPRSHAAPGHAVSRRVPGDVRHHAQRRAGAVRGHFQADVADQDGRPGRSHHPDEG